MLKQKQNDVCDKVINSAISYRNRELEKYKNKSVSKKSYQKNI